MKYWHLLKGKQCEYAKLSGQCMITVCIKAGEEDEV